ncbi:hypothetical protein ARMSODRAFT_808932 [Armillaria solidipes]|uniref:Uncharacterized protein n=1 Tax=Armillaria solidipes TaxID=1076256 RepID=A0A2H3AQQ9_9AGAR|nr:hypothetical protein ARMSODRAFT_808932 [Armillaria solidipes]
MIPRCPFHAISRQPLDSPTLAAQIDRYAFTLAGGTSSHRLAALPCIILPVSWISLHRNKIYPSFLRVLEREQRTYMLSLVCLPRLYGSRRLPPLILNGDTSRSPDCLFLRLWLYLFIGETGSQARLQYSLRLPYYRLRGRALSPLFYDLIRKTQGSWCQTLCLVLVLPGRSGFLAGYRIPRGFPLNIEPFRLPTACANCQWIERTPFELTINGRSPRSM